MSGHAADDEERMELVEILSRVLDKGVVVHGEVTIAVADVDLVNLDLTLILTSAETAARRALAREAARGGDADLGVLPADGAR